MKRVHAPQHPTTQVTIQHGHHSPHPTSTIVVSNKPFGFYAQGHSHTHNHPSSSASHHQHTHTHQAPNTHK